MGRFARGSGVATVGHPMSFHASQTQRSIAITLLALSCAGVAFAMAPSPAHAIISLTLRSRSSGRSSTSPTAAAERVNRYLCMQPETFTFSLSGLTVSQNLSIWRGTGCNTVLSRRDAAQCTRVRDATNITTPTSELPLAANILFDCAATDAGTKTIWFLVAESQDPDQDVPDAASIEIGFDFSVPPAVTGSVSATAGEQTVGFSWNAPSTTEIDGYVIVVEDLGVGMVACAPTMLMEGATLDEDAIDALDAREDVGKTSETGTVSGLEVDHTYAVGVITRDESGNYGQLSAIDCVTTQPVTDFWEAYQDAGGRAETCAAGPSGSTPRGLLAGTTLLGVLAIAMRRARRRRATPRSRSSGRSSRLRTFALFACALVAGAIALSVAPSARAQMRMLRESPQRFALALRFGPYSPDVDSELGGSGPFQTYFGGDARVLGGFELDIDVYVLRNVGRVGVGFGAAATHFGGHARTAENTASSESTGLTVFPMWLTAFVRIDALPRLISVPLVFTARFGLENDIWLVDTASDESPSGTTFGYRWALGLWLELDMFERRAARAMDENYGINHSYIVFDIWGAEMDGFGDGTSLILSDVSWTLGLAFAI